MLIVNRPFLRWLTFAFFAALRETSSPRCDLNLLLLHFVPYLMPARFL